MIVFTTDIEENVNLMAYNNNVVRFGTDTTTKVVLNASILINGNEVVIYPNPNGDFYFNFKDYVTSLVSPLNFVDTVNPDLDASDIFSFVYDGNGLLIATVIFQINFTDETIETATRNLYFIAGVEQLTTYKRNESQKDNHIVLSPLVTDTNNHYYFKYWEGFPFDITFLNLDYPLEGLNTIDLDNLTNLLSYSFNEISKVNRLFFCDGSTDETINDLLPIALGINEIQWRDKFLLIDKQDVCNGIYLKWVNNYGGYSYYNFGNIYKQSTSTRSIGELVTDFDNLSETFSQTAEIGKTAGERISVVTDPLNEYELSLLSPLLISPKVYLFTGQPFAMASANDWVYVKILPANYTTRNYKGKSPQLSFEIELPDLYTQTL